VFLCFAGGFAFLSVIGICEIFMNCKLTNDRKTPKYHQILCEMNDITMGGLTNGLLKCTFIHVCIND
jgi:hypothetical protein